MWFVYPQVMVHWIFPSLLIDGIVCIIHYSRAPVWAQEHLLDWLVLSIQRTCLAFSHIHILCPEFNSSSLIDLRLSLTWVMDIHRVPSFWERCCVFLLVGAESPRRSEDRRIVLRLNSLRYSLAARAQCCMIIDVTWKTVVEKSSSWL